MKTLIISLSLVLILILSGCKDNSTQPSDTSVIWPLKVGNYWEYRQYEYDSDGNLTNDTLMHLEVTSDTIVNGRHIYKIGVEPIYLYNAEGGLYAMMLNYLGKDSSILFLKYPVKTNDYFVNGEDTVFVTNTNSKITVPAGTFNCYQYSNDKRYDSNSKIYFRIVIYAAPGVGWVKTENYDTDFFGNVKLYSKTELISYKLN